MGMTSPSGTIAAHACSRGGITSGTPPVKTRWAATKRTLTVTSCQAPWADSPWTRAAGGEDEADEEAAGAAAANITNPITISNRVVMADMGETPKGDTNRITSEG